MDSADHKAACARRLLHLWIRLRSVRLPDLFRSCIPFNVGYVLRYTFSWSSGISWITDWMSDVFLPQDARA